MRGFKQGEMLTVKQPLHKYLFLLIAFMAVLRPSGDVLGAKCGTSEHIQIGKEGEHVSRDLPLLRASQSGRFMFHYALNGQDRVTETFLDSAEAILDHCWTIEVDSMGYPEPVPAVDGYVHVFLMDLPALYGYTDPVAASGIGLNADLVLDNDYFNPAHATRGINGLRVTAAHEFFHLIHFAMRLNPFHLYFYEWSSTWMEEQVYPEINDYLYYLPAFFDTPEFSIRTFNGLREYASAILPLTISDLAGDAVIHEAWVRFAATNVDPFQTLLVVANEVGYTPEVLAQEFAARLIATGRNAVSGFGFEDARWFPELGLTEGNCGDLSWCGMVGEWGILPGVLPGGVQGRVEVTTSSTGLFTQVSMVRSGSTVSLLPQGDTSVVNGTWAAVAAIALDASGQAVTMKAIPERAGDPAQISLESAWPNPSNGVFNWTLKLDRPGVVQATIYNLLGQAVATWDVSTGTGRTARLSWDGQDISGSASSSGMYILRAVAGKASAAQRIILIR
ncbi:T9SS type A sorting domain-containing protein [bacterium]|nr:T9SS type A sorting domain-containing protein [bacterium]